MKQVLFTAIALLFVILLSSCEGNTTREWKIRNNSSTIIYANFDVIQSPVTADTIPPGETQTFAISDARGGNEDPGGPLDGVNSILIFNTSDTLKKDYTLETNWLISSEQKKKRPSDYYHEYIFEVENGDF